MATPTYPAGDVATRRHLTGTIGRNVGIDLLKIVSIVAVVVGHIYGDAFTFKSYLEIWRMPLFFFLSGFFFTPGRPFTTELKNRWLTLGVPYLIWAVLMSVVAWLFNDTWEEFLEALFYGWYGGSQQDPPWWAFWFISVLFFAVLIRRFLERFPAWVAWTVAILGFVAAAVLPEDYQLGVILPLGIGLAIPCMFYILCGEAFRYHILPRLSDFPGIKAKSTTTPFDSTTLGFLGLGLVLIGMAAVLMGVPPHNIKFAGFGLFLVTPVVGVLMVCGMVMIFGTWVNALVQPARPVIQQLVRTGTVVVLAHGWLIMEFARLGVDNLHQRFILTVLTSWALGLLIIYSPLSRPLAGVPMKPFWRRILQRGECQH